MTGGHRILVSSAFELPLRIRISPSNYLAVGLLIAHTGAILLLWFVSIALWVKILLIMIAISSLYYSFYFYIWQKSPGSLIEIILNDKEEWLLIRNDGQVVAVTLRQGVFVHPLLIVLPFRYGFRFTSVILTPDKNNADALRRLRVRLRFKRKVNSEK